MTERRINLRQYLTLNSNEYAALQPKTRVRVLTLPEYRAEVKAQYLARRPKGK